MRYCLYLLIAITIASCSKKTVQSNKSTEIKVIPSTGEVIFNYMNGDIMSVKSIGYGETSEKIKEFAQKSVLENLLLRGIANSPYNKPLLEPSIISNEENKISDFIKTESQLFIISCSKLDETANGTYYNIEINVTSLKTTLTNKNLIRKFGY